MTYTSPLLNNRITSPATNTGTKTNALNTRSASHDEQVYQNLRKRANEVKPNEAKARLVNEGMFGNPITVVKDMGKDTVNLAKAITTGKASDSQLGNINDLGLKAGALLIATFLASQAKTKTGAIMQFIGGGTFLASMALWPKLFINLPARLVHGFRIDRKYISAQGDKKDFGLDNQFLVWDAYPEEQLKKDALNAGIDYSGKDGKEKIQRKIQKTMLQNRTLWMATAGFATPLMTALVGSVIEPKVQKAVVESEFKKAKKNIENGVEEYLNGVKPIVRNDKQIDKLFKKYQKNNQPIDEKFFEDLAKLLNPMDFLKEYRSEGEIEPLKNASTTNVIATLKKLYNEPDLDLQDLKAQLSSVEFASEADIFDVDAVESAAKKLSEDEINSIINEIGNKTKRAEIKEILENHKVPFGSIDNILDKTKRANNSFEATVKTYNKEVVSAMRARLKAYTNLVNSALGTKTETMINYEFDKTSAKLFEALGLELKSKDKPSIESISKGSGEYIQEVLVKTLNDKIGDIKYDNEEYTNLIKQFVAEETPQDLTDFITTITDPDNIKKISPDLDTEGTLKELNNALLGIGENQESSIFKSIRNYIENKQIDFETVKSKILVCLNFETRLKNGDFSNFDEAQIQAARNTLYNGTISDRANKGFFANPESYKKIMEEVFKEGAFEKEEEIMPGFQNFVRKLKDIDNKNIIGDEEYFCSGQFSALIKNQASKIFNNKAWKRIFVPMAIILGGATLLIQPFFGNIKKEFPDEVKNGGSK